MKRVLAFAAVASAVASALVAAGAPPRATLEVWGLAPGDALEVDGAPVAVKAGLARAFTGQPLVEDAPARVELLAGTHTVVVHRAACLDRTFQVETQGSYKRSLVLAPAGPHCAIPLLPPRAR